MAFKVCMPQLGLTMEEGTVSQWIKHEGDAVKTGDVLLEITTDKLTNEVTSEHDGVLLKIVAQEGEDVPVKGLLCYVGQPGEAVGDAPAAAAAAAPAAPAAPAAAPVPAPVAAGGARIRISPLARKTAAKLGVDVSGIVGSGPSGRIRQQDVLAAAKAPKAAAPVAAEPAPTAKPVSKTGLELMEGDTVVIESLSRLGRSTKDLIELVELFRERGVHLVSLKEQIDTSTPAGKLLFTLMSAVAQFERDVIAERTKEGLDAARARGHIGGRPRTNAQKVKQAVKLYHTKQYTVRAIEELTGVKKATLYRNLE